MIYHTLVRLYYTKSELGGAGKKNRAVYILLYTYPSADAFLLFIYIVLRIPDGHKYSYRVIYYIVMIGGSVNEDRSTYIYMAYVIYDGRRRKRSGDKNVSRLEFTASGRCGVRTFTRPTTTII